MDSFKESMIYKAEVAEDIMNGVVDKDNLIGLNTFSGPGYLTNVIAELLKALPHTVDVVYITSLVDTVNEVVPINKVFYTKYWMHQSSLADNDVLGVLTEAYSSGSINVFTEDWSECLCLLIIQNLNYNSVNMVNVIKYKNELKALISS